MMPAHFIIKLGEAAHGYGSNAGRLEVYLSRLTAALGFQGVFRSTPTEIVFAFRENENQAQRMHLSAMPGTGLDLAKLARVGELVDAVAAGQVSIVGGNDPTGRDRQDTPPLGQPGERRQLRVCRDRVCGSPVRWVVGCVVRDALQPGRLRHGGAVGPIRGDSGRLAAAVHRVRGRSSDGDHPDFPAGTESRSGHAVCHPDPDPGLSRQRRHRRTCHRPRRLGNREPHERAGLPGQAVCRRVARRQAGGPRLVDSVCSRRNSR